MCLLSPQHMSQQTCHCTDGFHCKNTHDILTFAGYCHTIYYHYNINLPIFFTATNLTSVSTPSESSSLTTTALLSSEITDEPSSSLISLQRKLLHLHKKMGHMNMVCLQQLIRGNCFRPNIHSLASCDAPLCHTIVFTENNIIELLLLVLLDLQIFLILLLVIVFLEINWRVHALVLFLFFEAHLPLAPIMVVLHLSIM
jgi:hypothetical protein